MTATGCHCLGAGVVNVAVEPFEAPTFALCSCGAVPRVEALVVADWTEDEEEERCETWSKILP